MKNLKYKKGFIDILILGLASLAILGMIGIASWKVRNQAVQQTPKSGTTNVTPINGATYNLAGSGVTSSATSIVLSSLTIKQSGQAIQSADLGPLFYLTLEPGNLTRQEVVSCTGVTQSSTIATLTGCTRGLAPISPYTASTTLQFAHAGGSQVVFGDAAQLFNLYAAKSNDETITGSWSFPSADSTRAGIGADTDTAVSTAFVTLGQLSRQAISGASNGSQTVKGIWQGGTQLQNASSTGVGSTGANLLLQSQYATSSPSIVCGVGCIPATQNNGKISPLFLNGTDTYNFNGAINASSTQNFIASSTQYNENVGTVIATSTVSSPAITLGGYSLAPKQFTYSTTTAITLTTAGGDKYATSTPITIPAGVLTASSTIDIYANITSTGGGGAGGLSFNVNDVLGFPFISANGAPPAASTVSNGSIHIQILANSSKTAQKSVDYSTWVQTSGTLNINDFRASGDTGTSAINTNNATSFYFVMHTSTTFETAVLTALSFVVNP